jgi:succinate dehydrogenase / fumarate reductase flavoprotein subunit/fumarate reductase flavoprotein subunit
MGAAAQMCALYAHDANPEQKIVLASKALMGKGGSSRMVQQGFNAVLSPEDSHEKHLLDTLRGGHGLNDQQLARVLVEEATPTLKELETKFGCFFDRDAAGAIYQKGSKGNSFDRKVRRGDWTGIEIIGRLTEQIIKRGIRVLEECRAVELILDASGQAVTGAVLFDVRRGEFFVIDAAATVLASGGGPTQYRYHAAGAEKCADGLAMLYRAGVQLKDMEMVQFHPSGLLAAGSLAAGTLFERGLRGAGAYLYNGSGERFMQAVCEEAEQAGRELVTRHSYLEVTEGRACPEGGLRLDASHLGAKFVYQNFPAATERCRQFGYDLGKGPVPVIPTAQMFLGGAVIDSEGRTSLEGLFVAGEDAGGVHGANRAGGNGITDSCVFGRQAGKAIGRQLATARPSIPESGRGWIEESVARWSAPWRRSAGGDPFELRRELRELNWKKVGVVRTEADLLQALDELNALADAAAEVSVSGSSVCSAGFAAVLDLASMVEVSRLVVVSALMREESRGAHFRSDFPLQREDYGLFNTFTRRGTDGKPEMSTRPVIFTYFAAGQCQKQKKKRKQEDGFAVDEGQGAEFFARQPGAGKGKGEKWTSS